MFEQRGKDREFHLKFEISPVGLSFGIDQVDCRRVEQKNVGLFEDQWSPQVGTSLFSNSEDL